MEMRGMTTPEHEYIRPNILRAGNFVQAAYDSFNSNTGQNMFSPEKLFSEVGFVDASKYRIHKFLYATSGVPSVAENYLTRPQGRTFNDSISNWMGFVACSTDAEIRATRNLEIYVVLRGTVKVSEWTSNVFVAMIPVNQLLNPARVRGVVPDSFFTEAAKVHLGWLSLYTSTAPLTEMVQSLKEQIKVSVTDLIDQNTGANPIVVVAGHSLGGALATLAAYDLAATKTGGDDLPVVGIVFSTPPVGNTDFLKQVQMLKKLRIFHYYVQGDVVPVSLQFTRQGYVPINSQQLILNPTKSPHLTQPVTNLFTLHNLEVLLHLLAGYNGSGPFKFVVPRSLALINKDTDASKAYNGKGFPSYWWSDKNKKGMVFNAQIKEWMVFNTQTKEGMVFNPQTNKWMVFLLNTQTKEWIHKT